MTPWEAYPTIWKSQAAYFAWMRGGLRRVWSKSPIKLEFLKEKRKRIPNPNPRGRVAEVWGCTCAICGKDHVMADIEVDHIVEAGSLTCVEDIQGFVERLLMCGRDDLQAVCKPCHKIKSYAAKQGLDFGDAKAAKEALEIQKGGDKLWLRDRGVNPATTKAARKIQILEILLKEKE